MEMPPMLNWFVGRSNYGLFMEWVFEAAGKDWLLREVAANGGQPGFAAYRRVGGGYELHTLQVFTITAEGISRNSVFQDPEVFAAFGLPTRLDAQGIAYVGSGVLFRRQSAEQRRSPGSARPGGRASTNRNAYLTTAPRVFSLTLPVAQRHADNRSRGLPGDRGPGDLTAGVRRPAAAGGQGDPEAGRPAEVVGRRAVGTGTEVMSADWHCVLQLIKDGRAADPRPGPGRSASAARADRARASLPDG